MMGTAIDRVVSFIEGVARDSGLEIVDLSIRKTRAPLIEIFVDRKSTGATSDDCARLNIAVRDFLESEGLFQAGYTLDVCTPGLDRVIKSDREFEWATGKEVEVSLHTPLEGENVFSGLLRGIGPDGEVLIEMPSGEEYRFNRRDVAKVRLSLKI